jgi:hypothetical protein
VLSFAVAGALLIALIRFVDANQQDSNQATENAAGAAQQNEESAVLVAEDQAPHTVRVNAGTPPSTAIERAIHADMLYLIEHQVLDGPLGRTSCSETGRGIGSRVAFTCTVEAGNVSYPFLGVVDVTARQLTYCKRDPPPIPSENIPVSPRCRLTG